MALASVSLVSSLMLRAQDSITIKDPAEFNNYQLAIGQSNAASRASALESFLTAYPQSVVKNDVLDRLLNTYYNPAPQGTGEADKALSAASRLLQVDPNNLEAILYSVIIKKGQCTKSVNPKTGVSGDPQTCDDAASLARKGLLTPKPAGVADADWKSQTGLAFPNFHSAIAADDAYSKKDFKSAVDEYTQELMLYTDDQAKHAGLMDTYLLAQDYTQPDAKDLVKAVWFYARVWNFVPAQSKPNIEKQLEYWYNKFHGNLDGLDDVKAKAALTTFPSGFVLKPAPTPAEKIHDLIVATPDLRVLNLGDKETVLAIGTKEDADKLWSVLKDEATPIPGTVISAPASAIKVTVTQGVKPSEFLINLAAPVDCSSIALPAATDLKAQQEFILASGVKDDTAKLSDIFDDQKSPVKKIAIEPVAKVINVAVTPDAKTNKTADFIVNLKTPVSCKEAPAAGFVYGISKDGKAELDGTYDTYKQIPATDTAPQSAQIVLRDATIVSEKKKPAGAAHPKPPAAHHAAAH
jgi:tetratricopeptide (TPR) repeat protein